MKTFFSPRFNTLKPQPSRVGSCQLLDKRRVFADIRLLGQFGGPIAHAEQRENEHAKHDQRHTDGMFGCLSCACSPAQLLVHAAILNKLVSIKMYWDRVL